MIQLASKAPEPLARTLALHLDDINQASTATQVAFPERETAMFVQLSMQQPIHC
jgi:hypothetical protein